MSNYPCTHRLTNGNIVKFQSEMPIESIICHRCRLANGESIWLNLDPVSKDRLWFCTTPECLELDSTQAKRLPSPKPTARSIMEKYSPYKD